MRQRIAQGPVQAPEPPGVVKSQHPLRVEHHVPVIMRPRRDVRRHETQASRHAEMHDRGTRVETDQDVFGSPLDAADCLVADRRFENLVDRPAEAAIANYCLDHAAPEERGSDPSAGGFYFRQFGQERGRSGRSLLDLRFFVGDVLAHDRIEFLRFHFVRMQTLVLRGRVVVSGAGG
jgi:hypothetical protein